MANEQYTTKTDPNRCHINTKIGQVNYQHLFWQDNQFSGLKSKFFYHFKWILSSGLGLARLMWTHRIAYFPWGDWWDIEGAEWQSASVMSLREYYREWGIEGSCSGLSYISKRYSAPNITCNIYILNLLSPDKGIFCLFPQCILQWILVCWQWYIAQCFWMTKIHNDQIQGSMQEGVSRS